MGIEKGKIKIYHEFLPRYKNGGINWAESIGKYVKFECVDISGEFLILDYIKEKYIVILKYEDRIINLSHSAFIRSQIYKIFYPFKFQYEIGDTIYDDKRNLKIIDRRVIYNDNNTIKKYYKYVCQECNYIGEILESSLNNLIGCPCCSNKVVVSKVNDITTTDPWMVPYFQGGEEEARLYTHASGKQIYPICPICGTIKDKPVKIYTIYHLHSIGCKCSDNISYPEKFVISLLDQLKIKYIYQLTKTTFEWCGKYKYDFYLPDYNMIIETHGEQHYSRHGVYSKYTSIENQQKIDMHKKELAMGHGIQYIVLDCRKSDRFWIENSIRNEMNNIFDLSNIDFIKCDEFATSNLVKVVCEEYHKNYPVSTSVLSKKFNLHQSTIVNYLKRGTALGWCNYNPNETRISSRRSIDLFKDNILIKTYPTIKSCVENSVNDTGIVFSLSSVNRVLDKNKIYKGYIFSTHIENEVIK